tara:strand:- start:19072 stop:19203 length:132 start_codon:yes stop_codon:yes gene_type:complete
MLIITAAIAAVFYVSILCQSNVFNLFIFNTFVMYKADTFTWEK